MAVITLATPKDAAAIAALSRVEIEEGLPWRWTSARVAHAIADPATNVAVVREVDGLVAFAIMKYADDAAHLLLLAVDPARRRNGVGTALLRWLEAVALTAGIRVIRLETRDDKPAARAFYGRLGYREKTLVAGMYCGMKDGIRIERDLLAEMPQIGKMAPGAGADMDIKDIIKDNHIRFLRFRQGNLYYAVSVPGEATDYMFPVPVEDIGDATLHARENAILFMRYIRKAMDDGSFVPVPRDG